MMEDLEILEVLIGKQIRGEHLDEAEKLLVEEWRQASPHNQLLLEQLQDKNWVVASLHALRDDPARQRIWQKVLDGLPQAAVETNARQMAPVRQLYWPRFAGADVAALLIFFAGIAGLVYYGYRLHTATNLVAQHKEGRQPDKRQEPRFVTLIAPPDNNTDTILPDGTHVWLNAHSSLRYPVAFDGASREVSLNGEAYFEVSKNISSPFEVITKNDTRVIVLGTSFIVRAYANETATLTTLKEGSLKILRGERAAVLDKAGEQAKTDSASNGIDVRKNVDVEAVMAWRSGNFCWDNKDLPTVMSELCRWYGVEMRIEKGVASGPVSQGKIPRSMTLPEILSLLDRKDLHFTFDGKTIIVHP